MKKLQLKMLELGATELLTRAQLKKILGGNTCAAIVNMTNAGSFSHSGASEVDITGTTLTMYGVDKSTASGAAAAGGDGSHWCCDSCSSATWYHPTGGSGSF